MAGDVRLVRRYKLADHQFTLVAEEPLSSNDDLVARIGCRWAIAEEFDHGWEVAIAAGWADGAKHAVRERITDSLADAENRAVAALIDWKAHH